MTFPSLPYRRLSASVLSKQTAFLNKLMLLGKWKKTKTKLYDLFFSSSFTAWRTLLFAYLLLFTRIFLVQKGLNIATYFKYIASDKSRLLPLFCLKVNRIHHFIHRNQFICFIFDSYHADLFHNLLFPAASSFCCVILPAKNRCFEKLLLPPWIFSSTTGC